MYLLNGENFITGYHYAEKEWSHSDENIQSLNS